MDENNGHLVLRFRQWAVIEVSVGDYLREVVINVDDLIVYRRSSFAVASGAKVQALLPISFLPETRPHNTVILPPAFLQRVREHPNIKD